MSHAATMFLIIFGLFLGMLLFLEIGRRIGIRRMKEDAGASGGGCRRSRWRGIRPARFAHRFHLLRSEFEI